MIYLWSGFIILILFFLALDLGLHKKKTQSVSITESLCWTMVWVILALLFTFVVFYIYEHNVYGMGEHLSGKQAALQYFTGYVLEKSLSLDNLFVIALIFSYFNVPGHYQHRVLVWGIVGALILRGVMIGLGGVLLHQFDWMTYVFGFLLFISAVKMIMHRNEKFDPDKNIFIRTVRKYYPVTSEYHGQNFFVKQDGHWAVTPLFLSMLMVETSDVMFAIDSIPAIYTVTQEPFLVFASNVFALLGLRSLYFALAGIMDKFRFLKLSLMLVLMYVGVKMILSNHYHIPTGVSLGVIGGTVAIGLLASLWFPKKDGEEDIPGLSPVADVLEDIVEVTWKQLRRVVILLAATVVILAGVAMLLLPGPGWLTIFAGIVLLSTEFVWAKKLVDSIRAKGGEMGRKFGLWKKKEKKDNKTIKNDDAEMKNQTDDMSIEQDYSPNEK